MLKSFPDGGPRTRPRSATALARLSVVPVARGGVLFRWISLPRSQPSATASVGGPAERFPVHGGHRRATSGGVYGSADGDARTGHLAIRERAIVRQRADQGASIVASR